LLWLLNNQNLSLQITLINVPCFVPFLNCSSSRQQSGFCHQIWQREVHSLRSVSWLAEVNGATLSPGYREDQRRKASFMAVT
jgi:hypothetical protein